MGEWMPRSPHLRVQVTAEDIQTGVQSASGYCMVAEAIKREVPWARRVSVDLQTIRVSDPEKGIRMAFLTPLGVQRALIKYDQGVVPDPFRFHAAHAHVTRITTRPSVKAAAEERAAAGRALPNERAAERPTRKGPTTVRRQDDTSRPIRKGGVLPPVAVLAHDPRRGRVRTFGGALAGKVRATDTAIAGFGSAEEAHRFARDQL